MQSLNRLLVSINQGYQDIHANCLASNFSPLLIGHLASKYPLLGRLEEKIRSSWWNSALNNLFENAKLLDKQPLKSIDVKSCARKRWTLRIVQQSKNHNKGYLSEHCIPSHVKVNAKEGKPESPALLGNFWELLIKSCQLNNWKLTLGTLHQWCSTPPLEQYLIGSSQDKIKLSRQDSINSKSIGKKRSPIWH